MIAQACAACMQTFAIKLHLHKSWTEQHSKVLMLCNIQVNTQVSNTSFHHQYSCTTPVAFMNGPLCWGRHSNFCCHRKKNLLSCSKPPSFSVPLDVQRDGVIHHLQRHRLTLSVAQLRHNQQLYLTAAIEAVAEVTIRLIQGCFGTYFVFLVDAACVHQMLGSYGFQAHPKLARSNRRILC